MKKSQSQSKKQRKTSSVAVFHTSSDLRTALLIVSLLVNLFVICVWIVVRITPDYDQALIQFFFNR